MSLTLGSILRDADIDLSDVLVIRHAYVVEHEDSGLRGIHAESTDAEILAYTGNQSTSTRSFPAAPPRYWAVFVREGGDRARLWSVMENRGEVSNDGVRRVFDLVESDFMTDLQRRLVIGWSLPRRWWMYGAAAAGYPVVEIADAELIPFPGFDRLVLDYPHLQAVMREHRYASWRTALASVVGIYLITDTRADATMSAKPMARRTCGNAGTRTRRTDTAATSNSAALTRLASDTRCYVSLTPQHPHR